ncbi:hypothetical protein [Burkholderia stabilis]
MNTHDVLAYAVATQAVERLRTAAPPWNTLFSADAYVTASRVWPIPDFVIVDNANDLQIAAEFKPPQQSKREYLTGLGQAIAYSLDFHYALLVLPEIADDGYRITEHVVHVMQQNTMHNVPVGVLSYDPATFSPHHPNFTEAHFFSKRVSAPLHVATLDSSFYAKWREMSPEESLRLLKYCYEEMGNGAAATSTILNRAFSRLWLDIQSSLLHHWGGGIRRYQDTVKNKGNVLKNYKNFLFHIGWIESDGALTKGGLEALHTGTLYGAGSRPFLDTIATALLGEGKHLILFNAISEYQDAVRGDFPGESDWLDELEEFLEAKGLLKRNPERSAVAVAGSARQFLKAEKQLWKQLELIKPNGSRVFHRGRGLIFNWSRIAELLKSTR